MTSEQNSPALLLLAAGMGSRYGGLKQVEPVGPNGETLMDYSLYDARRAGFSRVCFLIREEMYEIFQKQIGRKYDQCMQVEYAYQSIDDLPDSIEYLDKREKPWGTGHAVWCARKALAETSFAVLNADDFYGSATFRELWHSLNQFKEQSEDEKLRGAMIGYRLRDTLSEHGSVSRGICKLNKGWLETVEEWSGILSSKEGIEGKNASGILQNLSGEEIVSMNVWAFPPGVFTALGDGMMEFFKASSNLYQDEFYLPAAVDQWIKSQKAVFHAAQASSKWMGVTYREDKKVVVESIEKLIADGEYPRSLF